MIDLPYPPVQACVSRASPEIARARVVLTVSGDSEQVAAFAALLVRHAVWTIKADAASNGIRFLRIAAPADVPYREMGGLIFEAQRRRLEVSFSTIPPVCEAEEL